MFQSLISLHPNPSFPILTNHNNHLHTTIRCKSTVRSFAPTSSPSRNSLYEVLRLNRNASPIEIKAAYRSLAKLYHPDAIVNDDDDDDDEQSDGRHFIEIHNAYETLSDPTSRAIYDLSLGLGLGFGRERRHCYNQRRGPSRRWETDQCW